MPRKKATIHNGGGLIPKALKSKAKALYEKMKAKALYEKMFKRGVPVHPGIPPQQQRNIQNLSPSVVQEISPQQRNIQNSSPSVVQEISPQQINIQNLSPSVVQEIPPLSIIEIANKWMEDPKKDPYTNKDIVLSIHPNSRYVKLYKKIIDKLIKYLFELFPEKKELTIEDCKYIKNNLPIIHSIISIDHKRYIKYDHLFIIYFVERTRKYKYDSSYREDNEIKLYLNIYNSILTKEPLKNTSSASQSSNSHSSTIDIHTSIEFLLKDNMDLNKTDICIGKLVVNLCSDILQILYMHKSKITEDNYNIALNNKKILAYVASLYKLNLVKGSLFKDINQYYYLYSRPPREGIYPKNVDEILYIYDEIKKYIQKGKITNDDILNKFIELYNIILSLYSNYFNKVDPSELITKNPEDRKSSSRSSSRSRSKKGALKLNPYCPKDAVDPVTLRTIRKFDDKKRKYVVNILYYKKDKKNKNNNKVLYYCFDTIEIYNYILICIKNNRALKNLRSTTLFTDDDLDEICNKIKKFTDKPTYNSHVDIKEAIAKQRGSYIDKIYLVLSKEPERNNINYKKNRGDIIIGKYNIYINLDLGGLILRIINTSDDATPSLLDKNSFVLSLPIFSNKEQDKEVLNFIIYTMRNSLRNGKYTERSFPYRNGRVGNLWDKIVDLPPFYFNLDDDANITYNNFQRYIENEKSSVYFRNNTI